MIAIIVALAAFGLQHVVPSYPPIRNQLRLKLGRAYGPLYGLASLLTLALLIAAIRTAGRTALYDPPAWGTHANFLLTLVCFLLLGVALFRGSWRNRIRFPVALGIMFWGVGHLLANGDLETTVFFGGLMLLALIQFLLMRRSPPEPTEERGGHNGLSLIFGVALYGLAAQLHGTLIGIPVVQLP